MLRLTSCCWISICIPKMENKTTLWRKRVVATNFAFCGCNHPHPHIRRFSPLFIPTACLLSCSTPWPPPPRRLLPWAHGRRRRSLRPPLRICAVETEACSSRTRDGPAMSQHHITAQRAHGESRWLLIRMQGRYERPADRWICSEKPFGSTHIPCDLDLIGGGARLTRFRWRWRLIR